MTGKEIRKKASAISLNVVIVCVMAALIGVEFLILSGEKRQQAYRTSTMLVNQVEDILTGSAREEKARTESMKQSYISKARIIAYIIDHAPGTEEDPEALREIARLLYLDEIDIFDASGTIRSGTVPEYYGLSFDSGEQMACFKPMLEDSALAMCQDVMPNTAEGKAMMYAICWNDAGDRMVQVGVDSLEVSKRLRAGEVSEIIDSMTAYEGVEIIVSEHASGTVIGSTVPSQVGVQLADLGIRVGEPDHSGDLWFSAEVEGVPSYCLARVVGDDLVTVAQTKGVINRDIPLTLLTVMLFMLLAVAIISHIVRRMNARIMDEQKNANTDTLTGMLNRRAYADEMKRLRELPRQPNLTYLSLDLNGLKAMNDQFGHEAGDELIIGASRHIDACFGQYGTLYRIGGDEFVAIIYPTEAELENGIGEFKRGMAAWTGNYTQGMNMSYGCVRAAEHPQLSLSEISRLADELMYEDKARFYRNKEQDRRRR